MAVTFKSIGTTAKAGSGNLTPGAPTSGATGDIYVCLLMTRDNVVSTMTTDWTNIYGVNNSVTSRATAWWHRRAAADPSFAITHVGGDSSIAAVAAYSGASTTGSPVDASGTTPNASTTEAIVTAPTVTPSRTGDRVLLVIHAADNGSAGVFSGAEPPVERLDDNTNLSADSGLAFDDFLATSSATGARTSTYSLPQFHIGGTIAILAPAASTSGGGGSVRGNLLMLVGCGA